MTVRLTVKHDCAGIGVAFDNDLAGSVGGQIKIAVGHSHNVEVVGV